jgi:predicted GNAT family N-acyltransferase
LAGENAQTKLKAYKRDFDNARIGTLIAAAEQFNLEADEIQPTQPKVASELWEQAINRLNQIPRDNPQYLQAQKLLAAYQVKLKTVVDPRSDNYIEGAKQFALAAAKASQNPPHPADKWEQIAKLWQKSIDQLEKIPVEDPSYVTAQKLLAEYQTNLGVIQIRQKAESEGQATLKEANQQIQRLIASSSSDPQQLKAQIQGIINQLQSIKNGTTAYAEAQRLVISAQNRLKK